MVGIYKITNPKGEIYIGLSKNIENRWNQYKNLSINKKPTLLSESFKKFDFKNHICEVVEEIDISNLDYRKSNSILRKRERYWIKFYNSFNNGLNGNRGGSGTHEHSPKSKQRISEALKGKPKPKNFGKNRKKWQHTEEYKEKMRNAPRNPILMYDLDWNFIKEFPTQQKAADFLGVKKQAIWNYLNKHLNYNGKPITHVRGHKFKYKEKT